MRSCDIIKTGHNRIYKTPLPKATPHVCRHAYCSNMVKSGMKPKRLQDLMGYSDFGVMLNTYTHLDTASVEQEMERLAKAR